ncbi:hypothetical protein JTE90_008213 [Oedothorax gibbosus]|uniref:DDE-1 domain-containing protein n=1 Tax=Oedothorax gibbosus TaxID=931172 RepID=A0AAV6TV13_9ARAC|nr:hypothetical protein JTE90_008213 [Oedothorax gibbosus]
MTTADRDNCYNGLLPTINAVGNSRPSFFIFPRVNSKNHILKGIPPEWSNEEIFVEYLQHFIHYVKPSPDEPVVMILDNHGSHISFPAITCAKTFGIMISILQHTSHKMQKLDKTVFRPFESEYSQAADEWTATPAIMERTSPFMM